MHDDKFLCKGAQRLQGGSVQEKSWPKEELNIVQDIINKLYFICFE